ncbi:MAG: Crp/Fnr family transcriptional regulator [Gemmatimonadaceae bacterium]
MQLEIGTGSSRLSEVDQGILTKYAARAAWPAGFSVYQRGSNADGVFIVTSGHVVLRSRAKAGRSFVPWIAVPGETFGSEGLALDAHYATDARVEEETSTLFLDSTRFRAFVREQPQHSLTLINQLMAERGALLDRLRELTTLSVEQRLVVTLVRLANNRTFTDTDGRVSLCPSRYRLLCELVGATRESVSLVFARLTGEGIVERQGTSMVVTSASDLIARLDSAGSDIETPLMTMTDRAEQTIQ